MEEKEERFQKLEMSGSQTNEVETFLPERRSVSVRVSAPWKAARVKAAVGTALGLQPASLALFGLFRGLLEAPIRYNNEKITCYTKKSLS